MMQIDAHPTWANTRVNAVNVEAVGVEVVGWISIEAFKF